MRAGPAAGVGTPSAGVPQCPAVSPALLQVHSYASLVSMEARDEYSRVADLMCRKLRASRYNGSYFDRGAKAGGRLCTPEGWFCCQVRRGPWIPLSQPPVASLGSPAGVGLREGSAQPMVLRLRWPRNPPSGRWSVEDARLPATPPPAGSAALLTASLVVLPVWTLL